MIPAAACSEAEVPIVELQPKGSRIACFHEVVALFRVLEDKVFGTWHETQHL